MKQKGKSRRILQWRIAAVGIVLSCMANVATADTFRWIGYGTQTDPVYAVDWSDGSKWTNITANVGNVCPGDTDDVVFISYPAAAVEYDVTPPASFCGTISGIRYNSSRGYWLWPRIALTDSADAQYTIVGDSTFVASEHLGARIGADFTGVIDITNGVSFTIPASVTNAVEFVGDGTAVLTDAAQLDLVQGMTGVIDASGLAGLSLADFAPLEGHDVILPANTTLDSGRMTERLVTLPDWNTAGAWSFGGVQDGTTKDSGNYTSYQHNPAVQTDGTLLMTDDYSQKNVAWLNTRTFGYDDVWQIKFSYQAKHPSDAHPYDLPSGTYGRTLYGAVFGAIIAPGEEGVTAATGSDKGPAGAYGMRFYSYGNYRSAGLLADGSGAWGAGQQYQSNVREARTGISQINAPIDVTISMRRGRMFVHYAQGAAARSFILECAALFSGDATKRYTLGFFANTSSDGWQHAVVSNFSGWCMTQDAGQWTEKAACRITTSNWNLYSYTNGAVTAENRIDPADLILPNGDFMFMPNQKKSQSSATCQTALNSAKKVRVDYDIKWGTKSAGQIGEGIAVGFVNTPSVTASTTIGAFSMQTKYNPISWSFYYYQDRMGLAAGGKTIAVTDFAYGCTVGSGLLASGRTLKCSLATDGVNVFRAALVNSANVSHRVDLSVQYGFEFATRFASGMYPHFCGANSSAYVETDISNFRAYEWSDDAPPATLCGVIRLTGETPHGLAVNGELSFASGSKIILPAAWKSAEQPFSVVSVTEGTLSQIPAVELDDGRAVSAACLSLSDDGRTLNANLQNLHSGMILIFR